MSSMDDDCAATSHTPAVSIMPSVSSSSNNNNNNNNNNINNNNNAEQPQTKRQKIEKIKTNTKNAKATTTSAAAHKSAPPDIIESSQRADPTNGVGAPHLCSSLSSSAHSISTPSTSTNNSPTSTPCSSRATSLAQLLNVQNLVNRCPISAAVAATSHGHSTDSADNGGMSSSSDQSADEVDRVVMPKMPSNLAHGASSSSCSNGLVNRSKPTLTAAADETSAAQDMREFEQSLTRQCLCGVSERTLRKPFQSHYSLDANGQKRIANLSEWPTEKLLQFLSNLQLLFDIYLKQNSKGFICARIMDVCDALIRNDHNLIDEIIVLAGYSNAYVQFLAGRVLAAFLVIAKQEMDDDWLKKLVDNLFNFDRLDHTAVQKIHFSLEIIKRIVEWKDVDLHPLEDEIVETRGNAGISDAVATTSQDAGAATHAYMHFHAQRPSLESNYFALHFRDDATSNEDDDDEEHGHASDREDGDNDDDEHDDIHGNDREDDEDEDEDDDAAVNLQRRRRNLPHLHRYTELEHMSGAFAVHETAAMSDNFLPSGSDSHMSAYVTSSSSVFGGDANAAVAAAHYGGHYAAAASISVSDSASNSAAATANNLLMTSGGCHIVTLTDSESFDTTHLKCVTIKILENKWPALVKNMSALIANHLDVENAENCILNFLQLWENIISVKANLSIVETLPFYAQLDKFELLLNQSLSCTVYKQMLCLFNEALCYGSTLALQDMLPDETCLLAHQIVRHVKDFRILESLPRRQPENIVGLIGFKRRPLVYGDDTLQTLQPHQCQHGNAVGAAAGAGANAASLSNGDVIEMDKTILQKMVLLVLKSIAVTVKEIRSDSSDSSIDSNDYDAFQDMVLIERSIRDVLRKLESFIKHTLEFHPECHFSKILIHLFDDQDDHLIEAMVCTLDVTAGISFRNNAFPELVAMLNPAYTFLEFLKMISNSSDLLLDLLVSNETCFLLYLLRFLKYIRMNWSMFVQSCHDFGMGTQTLDEAMSVLIRLRLQISRLVSRQLYPYDISPVLRLLESCESLYEGNELS